MASSDIKDLELLIRSRIPVIIVETQEERRTRQLFTELSLTLGRSLFEWSIANGLKRCEYDAPSMKTVSSPDELLKHIRANTFPAIYLLLDFHPYLDDPTHIRLMKEIALNYENTPNTIVMISHSLDTPPELRMHTARFELALPNEETLEAIIREEAQKWSQNNQGQQVRTDRTTLDKMVRNLTGLTASDARRLARGAIADDGAITEDDFPTVMEAKYKLLDRDGALAFEYDTARFGDVGGLSKLKRWLKMRADTFFGRDQMFDPPKGILLVGVQGCGKSLAAKAVAGMWQIPLLRLDMGTLYNKYIGETEKNLREAMKTAEVMSPCVLWIDEIEKAISDDNSDGGVSRRLLGTLLTWMAEKKESVFIVATANDIERLPPELIRKGRLDEIFFVDLPSEEVREIIFEIHLKKRKQAVEAFDLKTLAAVSNGFTGAEIEQVIVSGFYLAREKGEPLATQHLIEEIDHTRPLSVIMAEKIDYLRQWASERTVNAD